MDELEQTVARYLLGELPEQEQAALEKSYFNDPHVFDQVVQVESRLVDAYARGQLSSEMRERLEESYLKHPSRRERVEFAKALTSRIDKRTPASSVSWWQRLLATVGGQRPKLRFSMALASIVIVLAAAWIFVTIRRPQQEQRAQIHSQPETHEETAPQQATVIPPPNQ